MSDTMKTFLKQYESTTNNQPQSLQVESTQILLEQENQKKKQSMIGKWNQNLTKRKTEIWQQTRNDNTSKIYESWKNNAPMIIPRKLQVITETSQYSFGNFRKLSLYNCFMPI